MRRLIYISLSVILLNFLSFSAYANGGRMDESVDYLFQQVKDVYNSFWNRVHAVEYLIDIGYKSEIRKILENDTTLATMLPERRIGYLRCLANASYTSEEKGKYVNQILNIYLDKDAPDLIYAVETLSKLRKSLKEYDVSALKGDSLKYTQLKAYDNWGKVYDKDHPDSLDYTVIFNILENGADVEKKIMSYGISYMGLFNVARWKYLFDITTTTHKNTPCFVSLLHGLVNSCPDRQKFKDEINQIKNFLIPYLESSNKSELIEALLSLEKIADYRYLEKIESINDNSKFSTEEWRDICAAKAFCIEKIKQTNKQIHRFSWLDWSIVVLILLGMLYVGYTTSNTNKTQKDYLLGGKSLSSNMVGVSLFATLFSTLSYLAFPGEMIKYGPVYFTNILSFPIATWIVGKYLIPKFVSMNVTSAYEILEIKLGKGTRILANIFFLVLRFLWMSTIIYATVDAALVPILGVSRSLVPFISIILVLITVLYTTMGGLKAVVITDVLQSGIMFLGVILVIGAIFLKVGSVEDFLNPVLYEHWNKIEFSLDPTKRMTVANIFFMSLVWQICTSGSDQMAIQRYLSVKDSQTAKRSYAISLATSAVIQLLLALVGLMVMVYFYHFPEQMAPETTLANDADILFPRFILVGLPMGITGLIAAAIMAAAMSSLSSGLNSSSAVILEDIVKKKAKRDFSSLKLIKAISALLGLAVSFSCLLVAYVSGNLLDIVIKVVNLVVAPLFVLFFMALFVPFATNRGTVIAGIMSLAVAILIAFFGIFNITVTWIMSIALIAGIIIGVIGSYVEKRMLNSKSI